MITAVFLGPTIFASPASQQVLDPTLLASPAPEAVLPRPLPAMGVQFHATWSDFTDAQRLEVLDKMAAANVEWVRIDVGWPSLQPHGRGSYAQWYVDRFEWVVEAARARDIQVLATLWGTPDWANRGQGRAVPPDDVADFAAVSRWMADRFRSRVAAWEVWNEPNHKSFWTGSPQQYAELLKASYPAFKAGDPNASVVLGGPSYNDDAWIAQVYEAGAQGFFDVMATHPYQGIADAPPETPDDGTKWTLTHVAAVHRLMKAHGDGNKPIWFTEFGWSSHENWPRAPNWQRGVTEEQQGDYLVRTLKLLRSDFPYVTNVFWYNERERDSSNIHLANYGLLERDLAPKPAYEKMKEFLTGVELLPNGGFEDGLSGWRTFRSRGRVRPGLVGSHSMKLVRNKRSYGITSTPPIPIETASTLTATGFVKGRRDGQKIRLIVTEKVNGSFYDRAVLRTTIGRGWHDLSELEYVTSGNPGSSIVFKLRSVGPKRDYFLADDLSLMSKI